MVSQSALNQMYCWKSVGNLVVSQSTGEYVVLFKICSLETWCLASQLWLSCAVGNLVVSQTALNQLYCLSAPCLEQLFADINLSLSMSRIRWVFQGSITATESPITCSCPSSPSFVSPFLPSRLSFYFLSVCLCAWLFFSLIFFPLSVCFIALQLNLCKSSSWIDQHHY